MFPKEHGAYGQLFFPRGTVLLIGRPRTAAFLLALAAIAAFLSHEPLLVAIGHRGTRAAREQGGLARRWFAVLAVMLAGTGAAGAWLAPAAARFALLAPTAGGVALFALIAAHLERTTGGEMLSAATLTSLSLPVALAAGVPLRPAATCILVFAVTLSVATVCVRAVILCGRRLAGAGTRLVAALVACGAIAAFIALTARGLTPGAGLWASLPICALGFVLAVASPSPRHLRRIGWTLMAATTMTAAILIVGLR